MAAAETDDDFDDDDNDGVDDDQDSDDDNDGIDDDNDGIADVFDSESTRDELGSSSAQLATGLMVECGCWNGLSSLVMCEYVRAQQPQFKGEGFHIFDSFEGLSEPTTADALPEKTITELQQKFNTVTGAFSARLEDVQAALSEFPAVTYHRGWLPESLAGLPEAKYKFVHIDVDLYEPTLGIVAYFYPRLVEGGLIICDDYGSLAYPGAQRAIDEYSAAHGLLPLAISTGQAVLWKR